MKPAFVFKLIFPLVLVITIVLFLLYLKNWVMIPSLIAFNWGLIIKTPKKQYDLLMLTALGLILLLIAALNLFTVPDWISISGIILMAVITISSMFYPMDGSRKTN